VVLNAKPIIFVYTDAMEEAYKTTVVSYINDFACYLDAAVYNIDEITGHEQIEIRKVDQARYENYRYDFLTSPESEQMSTQEIFWHEIATVEQ
jgi:pantothenate kinase